MRSLILFISLVLALKANALIYGFSTLSSEYKPSGPEVTVTNMPTVRDQDTLGICYSFSAAALVEHAICNEYLKDGTTVKKADCKNLPNSERPSVVDLSRYAVDGKAVKATDDPNSFPKMIHDRMTFGLDVLDNLFQTTRVSKESCIPFDEIVAKVKTSKDQKNGEAAMWKQFENNYNLFHKKFDDCKECSINDATTTANEMIGNYKLKTSNSEILNAFGATTYNEFLYKALVPEKCNRAAGQISLPLSDKEIAHWPPKGNSVGYSESINKIKDVLSKNRPVMVNRFCTLEKVTTDCKAHTSAGEEGGGHSFVISGYRKMCKKSGECKEALQVHNSWGQSWQTMNNDGWVDAKTLLNQTGYDFDSFAWLQPKSS